MTVMKRTNETIAATMIAMAKTNQKKLRRKLKPLWEEGTG